MTDLLELAARVEGLTGPDREVDALIADATGWWLSERERLGPNAPMVMEAARFTASLDAAMTLLGKHGVLMHLSDIGADGLPLACVGRPDLDDAPTLDGIASCIMTDTAPVAGLAIAVTAASLRARAHGGGEG